MFEKTFFVESDYPEERSHMHWLFLERLKTIDGRAKVRSALRAYARDLLSRDSDGFFLLMGRMGADAISVDAILERFDQLADEGDEDLPLKIRPEWGHDEPQEGS